MKKINLILLGFLVFMTLTFISAHTGDNNYGHHMSGNVIGINGIWGMGLFGWVFGIFILVALILLIVWLKKWYTKD